MEDLKPYMGAAEQTELKRCYARAGVILEYGSGGSTMLAARMPGKLVISVESDWKWAVYVQNRIDTANCPSTAILHHVDIGPTGPWGLPVDGSSWRRFCHYPLEIWDQPFFRAPDTALVDGRFRTACLMAIAMRTRKPVTVLFDDYGARPSYHSVERLLGRPAMAGLLARFELEPDMVSREDMPQVVAEFFKGRMAGESEASYSD